jgi:hypothetical protein
MSSIPNNFNWKIYLQLNQDLDQKSNEKDVIDHYINYGIHENRKYFIEIPLDFEWKIYLQLNKDLNQNSSEIDVIQHYINHGINEKRHYSEKFYSAKKYNNIGDISAFLSNIKNDS